MEGSFGNRIPTEEDPSTSLGMTEGGFGMTERSRQALGKDPLGLGFVLR